MGDFKLVKFLDPKSFHAYKIFPIEAFQLWMFIKTLNLDGLKCKLKSVYAVDFVKQALSIQEVR